MLAGRSPSSCAARPVDVLAPQQNSKQLFPDVCGMADFVSAVGTKPDYELLYPRRVTSTKHVTRAANRQVVFNRICATQPVRLYVIRLPRFTRAPATHVACAARLGEDCCTISLGQWHSRSGTTRPFELAKLPNMIVLHRVVWCELFCDAFVLFVRLT